MKVKVIVLVIVIVKSNSYDWYIIVIRRSSHEQEELSKILIVAADIPKPHKNNRSVALAQAATRARASGSARCAAKSPGYDSRWCFYSVVARSTYA